MWTLRVFVKSPWLSNPTTKAGLFYDETDAISLGNSNLGLFGPLSETFGFNVHLQRP
jgi:hypothetical protein